LGKKTPTVHKYKNPRKWTLWQNHKNSCPQN
jgi:hypothetical protein